MITLSLLPPELKKQRKSFTHLKLSVASQLPIFKICLYVAGGLVVVHTLLVLILVQQSYSLRGLKSRWEGIAEKRKVVFELTQRHEELTAREKTFQQLTSGRPLWARRLKGLSDSMVPGVWLRVLSMGERSVAASTPKDKGGKSSVAKILVLEGTVASVRGDELAMIGRFVRGLKENQDFFSDFQGVEVDSTRRRSIKDIEVMDFKIICTFREGVVL